jgi:hypothetical protein
MGFPLINQTKGGKELENEQSYFQENLVSVYPLYNHDFIPVTFPNDMLWGGALPHQGGGLSLSSQY